MMDSSMPEQMEGRYQRKPVQPLNQGQMPQGGPPSFSGGTPSGSQPMNAGMQQQGVFGGDQQKMPAPWTPPPAPGGTPPMGGAADTPMPGPEQSPVTPMPGGKMPAPWTPPAAGGNSFSAHTMPTPGPGGPQQPMGGQAARPQYQGAPGAMQRHQMTAPQGPGSPMSQRQNMQSQQNGMRKTF